MDLSALLPTVVGALVDEVAQSGPESSPLMGVDPLGRADVAASRVLERVVNTSNPGLSEAYRRVKPTVDALLVKAFYGTQFGERTATSRRGKAKTKPNRRRKQVVRA